MEELFRAADPDADTAMTAMQKPDVNVISLEINKIIDGRWINWYASDQTIGGEPAWMKSLEKTARSLMR